MKTDLVGLQCPICKTVWHWKTYRVFCSGATPFGRPHVIVLLDLVFEWSGEQDAEPRG